jgi:hypothetical protein
LDEKSNSKTIFCLGKSETDVGRTSEIAENSANFIELFSNDYLQKILRLIKI